LILDGLVAILLILAGAGTLKQVFVDSGVSEQGSAFNVLGETVGNAALKPEIARNTTFGVTLAQPQFLPGFSASIDYYDIRVNNEISALTAQQ
jgi:iron complex outermembrane recepter protein